MKTFLKIIAAAAALLVVIMVALNFYFTDERLQNLLMPYINESVGRPVEVGSMSATFFSTFPNPGVEVDSLRIPGETEEDTLLSMDRLVVGVELFPLFREEINITELVLTSPRFLYRVHADSSTNIDFLLDGGPADTSAGGYDISIPYFEVHDGYFGYRDHTSGTSATLDEVDGDLSLSYADSIQSSIDLQVGGFAAAVDSVSYVSGLPLRLTEESVIHTESEIIRLEEGTLAIRGLEMDLTGTLSNWSDTFTVDLAFNSSSDNFGELLRLVPEAYAESLEGFQSRGALDLGGTVQGPVTSDSIPRFDVRVNVQDGYLKDPDLPQAIENIRIDANATNEQLTIRTFNAEAGANTLTGSGTLDDPLEDERTFDMDFVADVDLSTVHQFYAISDFDIDRLDGQLDIDAHAEGPLNRPENVTFDGKATLADGLLKYREVPEAIRNISINAAGTQELFTIHSLRLQAAQNNFSAEGQIRQLLDEESRRINNMNTNLQFDLATIKDFYPIDEDTLRLEGTLTAQATLDGRADQIERAVQSGSINLENGLVDYRKFDAPFRNITLESVLDGPRMTVVEGGFQSGDNSVQFSGIINNYLSESRALNLQARGSARLQEIGNYYELKPDISELTGEADFNLDIRGPADAPEQMAFSGNLSVQNAAMSGESLREPVKDLNGVFTLTPQKATLSRLTFNMGSSDLEIEGALSNYMEYLKEEQNRAVTPQLTGQLRSNYLDLDELINWSDTTSAFNLDLPDLNGSFSAQIDRFKITGVTMRNLQARATSTPSQINLTQANVELFEGEASGTMRWEIPEGRPSTFNFKGTLDSLRLESFFADYPILGRDSRFHNFITGTFSTDIDYTTKIDTELNPMIPTTVFNGTFGMSKAQVQNHPLQRGIAAFTNIDALRDVALDQWESTVSVEDNILTISELTLTSSDLGMELNGTQHLQTDKIDFQVAIILPGRFKETIAPVITSQAASALTRDNGTLRIPLRITGTYGSPTVRPDQSVIKPIVREYLKEKAGNTIRDLFGRDKEEARPDTAAADTSSQR